MQPPGVEQTLASIALAAAVSGAIAAFVATPVELVKVVMQANDATTFSSPVECLQLIIKDDGIDGLLFRGVGATVTAAGAEPTPPKKRRK